MYLILYVLECLTLPVVAHNGSSDLDFHVY